MGFAELKETADDRANIGGTTRHFQKVKVLDFSIFFLILFKKKLHDFVDEYVSYYST